MASRMPPCEDGEVTVWRCGRRAAAAEFVQRVHCVVKCGRHMTNIRGANRRQNIFVHRSVGTVGIVGCRAPRSRGRLRRLLPLLVLGLIWSLVQVSRCRGADPPIQVGFSSTTLSEVDLNDAVVAIKVWFEQILKTEGLDYAFETTVYRDFADLSAAVRQRKVDVLTVSTIEAVKLAADGEFENPLSSEIGGRLECPMLLLVHKEAGITGLDGLRGKKLIIDTRQTGELPKVWLEVELARKQLPAAQAFFESVRTVNEKPSQAVLPVFFRQADACIVRQESFDSMHELNPQIGKTLVAIAKSEPMIRGLTLFRKGFSPERQSKIIPSAQRLPNSVKGRQTLMLFKVDNIKTIPMQKLDPIRRLYEEFLKTKSPAR